MFFAPVLPLVFGLSYFIRVDGRPVFAASGLILSALVNVVLDYAFIAGWGWGIGGAALATGGSQVFGLVLLLTHFFRPGCGLRLTRRIGRWHEVLSTFCNGSSEFVNETSGGLLIFMFNWIIVTRIGTEGLAAFSVVSYILLAGLMMAYGFSDPMAPLVSANMAAGKPGRAGKFLGISMLTVFGAGMLIFGLLALAPELPARLFLPDNPLAQEWAVRFLGVFKYMFLFSGINIVLATCFTGLHKALASATIAILRGIVMPVILILTLPLLLAEDGIFMVLPLSELLTLVVAVIWAARVVKFKPAASPAPRGGYALFARVRAALTILF